MIERERESERARERESERARERKRWGNVQQCMVEAEGTLLKRE